MLPEVYVCVTTVLCVCPFGGRLYLYLKPVDRSVAATRKLTRSRRRTWTGTPFAHMTTARLQPHPSTLNPTLSPPPQDVLELLDRVSRYTSANLDNTKRLWSQADSSQ